MMKAFLRDHRAQTAAPLEQGKRHASSGGATETTPSDRRARGDESQQLEQNAREEVYAEGYLSGMSVTTDRVSIDSTKIDNNTSPSRPGDETWRCTEEARNVFARLGEAAEA